MPFLYKTTVLLLALAIIIGAQARTTPAIEPLNQTPISSQSFTGTFLYNPLRHKGHFIGHLDEENTPFTLSLGYSAKPDSIRTIMAPYISIAKPNKSFFDIYYAPLLMSNLSIGATTSSQNLHLFGLGVAFQTDDGFFRMSFNGQGYAGKSTFDSNSEERLVLGVETFGLNFGWRIEDLVTVNVSATANGFLDTLTTTSGGSTKDRFSEMTLPQLTVGGYITNQDLPYRMGLDIGYGRRHFVYSTTNPGDMRTDFSTGNNENADALLTDSLAWDMMHQGDIPLGSVAHIQPALILSQSYVSHKRLHPGQDNVHLNYGGEVAHSQWKEIDFTLGGGLGFAYDSIVNYWAEFERTAFTGTEATVGINMNGEKHSAAYNRFATGMTFSPHQLPSAGFNGVAVAIDLSFVRSYQRIDNYTNYQFHMNENSSGTQRNRYMLETNGLNGAYTFNDFTMGVRSTFMDGVLGLDAMMSILKETAYNPTNESDLRLGINLTYSMVSP